MPSYNWSETEIKILKDGWLEGRTAKEIADDLPGRTRNMVIGKVHRLKLPKRPVIRRAEGMTKKEKAARQRTAGFVIRKATAKTRKAPVAIEPPLSVRSGEGKTLLQLKYNSCRSVLGYQDGQVSKAVYCGEQTMTDKSWCPYHHSIFTIPPRPR